MQWSDALCHPLWVVSTAVLALVVRLQRRGRWDPRACPVQLKGKTAIVTGANTGRWSPSTFHSLAGLNAGGGGEVAGCPCSAEQTT